MKRRKYKQGELKQRMLELDTNGMYPILAANILGISMRTLYTLSYRYNITFPPAPYGFNKFFQKQLDAKTLHKA